MRAPARGTAGGTAVTTFRQLLDQFEASAKTRTAKGRVFEQFCEAFFRTDPLWSERFDAVWSWMDWPDRGNRADTGIDLVAREAGTGRLVAIQCKFYSPDAVLAWGHVSTFAGMLAQPEFAEGMVVSTAGAESANVHTNLQRHPKPIVFWRVDDFEESRVDWSHFRIDRPAELADRPHDCDVLLDQNYFPELAARYRGLLPAHCQLLCGPSHALLRREFLDAAAAPRPRGGAIHRVLVFYGGALRRLAA